MPAKASILVGLVLLLALDPASAIVVHRRFYTPASTRRKAVSDSRRSRSVPGQQSATQPQKKDAWKCYWFGQDCSNGDVNYAKQHEPIAQDPSADNPPAFDMEAMIKAHGHPAASGGDGSPAASGQAYAFSSMAAEWESLAGNPQATPGSLAMSSVMAEWESLASQPQVTAGPPALSSAAAEWESLAVQPTPTQSSGIKLVLADSAVPHALSMSASAVEWESLAAAPGSSAAPSGVWGGSAASQDTSQDLYAAVHSLMQGDGAGGDHPNFMDIWNSLKHQHEIQSAAPLAKRDDATPTDIQMGKRYEHPSVSIDAQLAASTAAVNAYYSYLADLNN